MKNANASHPIVKIYPIDFQWPVKGPYIFCVHHLDMYPAGDGSCGPAESLEGRSLGNDFTPRNGWRMYHGQEVPGFPAHPHRGFETITITLRGYIDHFDSAGGTGRYGFGDVQWMTAGSGLQHSEMFPLTKSDRPNTLELFQIWLNLPRKNKMVEPYYGMHWSEQIPLYVYESPADSKTEIKVIAGKLEDIHALPPAPDSWAADPENNVRILLIRQDPGAEWLLPATDEGTSRMLYFYQGGSATLAGTAFKAGEAAELDAGSEITLTNGSGESFFLVLEGKALQEPVFQYGPFVMNSEAEIRQAFDEYRRTSFGGWPWPSPEYVHPAEQGRFARFADGKEELP